MTEIPWWQSLKRLLAASYFCQRVFLSCQLMACCLHGRLENVSICGERSPIPTTVSLPGQLLLPHVSCSLWPLHLHKTGLHPRPSFCFSEGPPPRPQRPRSEPASPPLTHCSAPASYSSGLFLTQPPVPAKPLRPHLCGKTAKNPYTFTASSCAHSAPRS